MKLKNHDDFLKIGKLLDVCRKCELYVNTVGIENKIKLCQNTCVHCDTLKEMQKLGQKVGATEENGNSKQRSMRAN